MTMGKDEILPLPMMLVKVVDADKAGAHFERGDTCTIVVKLAMRTDKGSPQLLDQVVSLTRSDIRDTDRYRRIVAEQAEGES